ncbi:MAG: hypothetical protein AB2807_02075 [Candidatus Sedimenticola endophacoides]
MTVADAMTEAPKNGTTQNFDGKDCIYYDGHWIRYYPIPKDTLANRKMLIDSLTKRTFHHTESGINTPGEKLEEAQRAFDNETHPAKKRVNGAMLAGALFNRATDIFTAIVELEEKGVKVSHHNELMRQCAECFKRALELGKQVKHYSGHEGIDELWGEPFKAFAQPLTAVFESRYRKIAATVRAIEEITRTLGRSLDGEARFKGAQPLIKAYAAAAIEQVETMRGDINFFRVWPAFVSAREALEEFDPPDAKDAPSDREKLERGKKLIRSGVNLITYLAEARVPMPKSTQEYLDECVQFRDTP